MRESHFYLTRKERKLAFTGSHLPGFRLCKHIIWRPQPSVSFSFSVPIVFTFNDVNPGPVVSTGREGNDMGYNYEVISSRKNTAEL